MICEEGKIDSNLDSVRSDNSIRHSNYLIPSSRGERSAQSLIITLEMNKAVFKALRKFEGYLFCVE